MQKRPFYQKKFDFKAKLNTKKFFKAVQDLEAENEATTNVDEKCVECFSELFASVGAQLISCCAHENSNLKTNRSKCSMVLSYVNETTVGKIINSMLNKNSGDEFSFSNALSRNLFL